MWLLACLTSLGIFLCMVFYFSLFCIPGEASRAFAFAFFAFFVIPVFVAEMIALFFAVFFVSSLLCVLDLSLQKVFVVC